MKTPLFLAALVLALACGPRQRSSAATPPVATNNWPREARPPAPPRLPVIPASIESPTNSPPSVALHYQPQEPLSPRQIRPVPGGALADFGRLKVQFTTDAGDSRPVTITTPDNQTLACRPSFLAFYNAATGESLLLGQVTNSIGWIIPPSQVIYSNAFDSIRAHILYAYNPTNHSLSQDILLEENPVLPESFRPEDTRLEVWTAWFGSEPIARHTQTILLRPASERASAVSAPDETADWGLARMVGGSAFGSQTPQQRLPVARSWVQAEGGVRYLVETVDYLALKASLDALSRKAGSASHMTPTRLDLLKALASVPLPSKNLPPMLTARVPQSARPPSTLNPQPSTTSTVVLDFILVCSVPVPPDAVSWWPAGGNASDALSTNNGTLIDGVTYDTGEVGQAFSFNGADGYVEVPSSPALSPTGPFTIEGWINYDSLYGPYGSVIVAKGEDVEGPVDWAISVSASSKLRPHLNIPGQDWYYFDCYTTLLTNTWYHVAMVYDGTNLTGYVNGADDRSLSVTGQVQSTEYSLRIGAYAPVNGEPGYSKCFFAGRIDELTFYSRALAPAEIQAIYNAGAAGKINPNCVSLSTDATGWWAADGDPYDLVQTNVATLHNGVTYESAVVAQAFRFNGTNNYAEVPSSPGLRFTNAFTVEGWINYESLYGPYGSVIVAKGQDVEGPVDWAMAVSSSCNLRPHVHTPGGWYYFDCDTALQPGGWYHVAMVYDGAISNLTGYVNGTWDGSMAVSGAVQATDYSLRIGAYAPVNGAPGYSKCFFPGRIDELTVYNRALSGTEIGAIYSAGCAGKCRQPPAIITQPTNQTVVAGNTASFTVVATGSMPLIYQWHFNGTNLPGGTNTSLTLTNVAAEQAGTYSVTVSNRAGWVTSSNASLTVLSPPSITVQPASQTVLQGSNVTFHVTATGTLPLHFQWTRNGTNISHANANAYTRLYAHPADAGAYAVTITNLYGQVTSSNAILTVNVLPAVTAQPFSQASCVGGSVLFAVSATGTAPLSYQWRKNGVNIPGETAYTYSRSSLSSADAGLYTVLITNAAGSVLSSSARLLIGQGMPALTLTPLTNGIDCAISLYSTQASIFISAVDTNITFSNALPTTLTVPVTCQTNYADALFGRVAGCSDSTNLGINLVRLSPPIISPTNYYLNYPSNVVISLGPENLTNLVDGLYRTELARTGTEAELTNTLALANALRNAGYSDEDIRTNLINSSTFRNSAEYAAKYGAGGDPYLANTNYFIQYSLDGGTNWSLYTGPFPIAATVTVQARVAKAGRADKRTVYASLTSDVTQACYTNIPAAWLIQYFGNNYTNDPTALPDSDPDGDLLTNLQEYQNGSNPVDNANMPKDYYQAASAADVISVDFTTNGWSDAHGPAAAGFDTNDLWNCYSSVGTAWPFSLLLRLRDSGGSETSAHLWAFTGPCWSDFRWGLPACRPASWDWDAYWYCWGSWVDTFSMLCGCQGYSMCDRYPSWTFQMGGLYLGLPLPDWWWWYGGALPEYWQTPLWLPAFDEGYPASWPLASSTGVAMRNDLLTSSAQNEVAEWLQYCGFSWDQDWEAYYWYWDWFDWYANLPSSVRQPPVHLFITGLSQGSYQLYLYGPNTQGRANGQSGVPMTWRIHTQANSPGGNTYWTWNEPYTLYSASPIMPGDPIQYGSGDPPELPGAGQPLLDWTNEPLWLPKLTSRIRIDFDSVAEVAGMQIVRIPPATIPPLQAPAPSALPGNQAVYLFWPPVRSAAGYLIYRSDPTNTPFTLIAATANHSYADVRLAPATTYSYYVVATNHLATSPPSAPPVAAQTFNDAYQPPIVILNSGDTNLTPVIIYPPGPTNPPPPNLPPTLNSIDSIHLAAQGTMFTVPFIKVLAASDAWDPNGDALSFKVEAALNGDLYINGQPFDPTNNCTFDRQTVLTWEPYGTVPGTGSEAFQVSAFDGSLRSANSASVMIVPAPKTYLVGWGESARGSLGNGYCSSNFCDRASEFRGILTYPVRVKNLPDVAKVSTIDAAAAAVTTDGHLWMWGDDLYGVGYFGQGQLHKSDTNSQGEPYGCVAPHPIPFEVQMLRADGQTLEPFTNVVDVNLGNAAVMAIRSDGTLWSWGISLFDSLGREVDQKDVIPLTLDWNRITKKAGQVTGFTNAAGQEIPVVQTVGGWSSLALCADGSVWSWGTIFLWVPEPTPDHPLEGHQELFHLADDATFHFGPNRLSVFDSGPKVIQIAGDGEHFAVLRSDGTVWELGYVPRLSFYDSPPSAEGREWARYFTKDPIQVTNLPTNIRAIRLGGDYALALADDGKVYAWGTLYPSFASPTPVQLPDLTNTVKIDLRSSVPMAIDDNGHVRAWGYNLSGLLGRLPDPSDIWIAEPQTIAGIENASDVIPGDHAAFAIASLEEGRPTGLTATPLNHAVRLDWHPYAGASYYLVHRATTNGNPGVEVGQPSSNTFTDSGDLTNGIPYFYTVSAIVDGAETLRSREVMAAPIDPPSQPDPPTALPTCRNIHLQWSRVANAASHKVYRAQSLAGPFALLSRTGSTNFIDQSASSGTTNWYSIVAVNSAGDSQPSALSAPVQLDTGSCMPAPTITSLSVPSDGAITISWTPVALITGTATNYPDHYRIRWHVIGPENRVRSITPSTPFLWDDISIGNLTPDGTNYSYTLGSYYSLTSDLTIWCKVAAVSNDEPGDDSNLVGPVLLCLSCTNFPPPSGLLAVPGCSQIYLEWDDTAEAAYYLLQYRTNSTQEWLAASDHIGENRFWHTNLTAGTNYEYRVCSVMPVYDSINGSSNSYYIVEVQSPPSDIVQTNPLYCAQPPSIVFTARAEAYDSMIYVHWESLTNQPPLRCFVERKLVGSVEDYSTITQTGFGLAYLDQDVVNGTTYSYRVNALDANYHRFQSTVSVAPTNSGFLNVVATPGNAHILLQWNYLSNVVQYLVKHSMNLTGPCDLISTLGANQFLHKGLQNGFTNYYIVTAVMPDHVTLDSQPVYAMPLATLRPLPPASLQVQVGLGTNGQNQLLFSWSPTDGAASYELDRLLGATTERAYGGPATSCAWAVPSSVTDGESLTFQVIAISSANEYSDPTKITFTYNAQQAGTNTQVLLSIGTHDVSAVGDSLTVTGPTNLVLRACVLAEDANDAEVYFYDNFQGSQTLIGSAQAPQAQVTWFHVPQGTHYVSAQAVTQPLTGGQGIIAGGGKTYDSATCALTVKMVPDLATYQTAATDLQLPAPGLPISLSRAYDSRNTNSAGCLGKGWSASWDQASLQLSTNLADGWIEAGRSGLWQEYCITDTNAHVVTVSLPGGGSAYFAAHLTPTRDFLPLDGWYTVSLDFMPFAPNQGFLTCDGSPRTLNLLLLSQSTDWGSEPLCLADSEGRYPFSPTTFYYTAPDGTQYVFLLDPPGGLNGKLTKIFDRNGNSLTYNYSAASVTNITHSNGRQVQLDYQTDGSDIWISLYDTANPKTNDVVPVVRYRVHDQFLKEVHKLITRFPASLYETNKYEYGTSGPDRDRLTDIYDPRGVRVLHNQYGTNSENAADGRLVSQADALNRTATFGLSQNFTLTATTSVGGSNETVTVSHDASGAIAGVQSGDQSVTNIYDTRGRLTAQTDALGSTKTVAYDSQDRPASQSDALGHTTSTDYSTGMYNQPGSTTDANGNTSNFEYDNNGNLTVANDPSGTRTESAYCAPITNSAGTIFVAGLLAAQTNYAVPYSVVTINTYYTPGAGGSSLPGELKTVVQEAVVGGSTVVAGSAVTNTYEYDANGNRTKETRWATVNGVPGTNIVTQYRYDAQNRLIETIDPLGRTNTVIYNKLGKQAATIDALGRTNTYTYDALGNLIETQFPDGSVTRTVYDEKNRPVWTQERAMPSGNQTTAPATTNIYDPAGKIIRVERRSGVVLTKWTAQQGTGFQGLAGADPQSMMTNSSPGTFVSCTRTVYDAAGRVRYSMDARGAVTECIYDAAGRRTTNRAYTAFTVSPPDTGTIAPSGAFTETAYTYDPNGNQVSVTDALGHETGYEYDSANRLIRTTFPHVTGESGRKSLSTTYDGLGRRTRETDEAGVITAFAYDCHGLLTSVTLDYGTSNSVTTSYAYDESGNLISQTDANGHTTSFQYDQLGRRTKRILPDNSYETTAYTDVPETTGSGVKVLRTATTDFSGRTLVVTNDRLDRISVKALPEVRLPDNTLVIAATTVSYSYDTNGQRAQVMQSGGVNRTNRYAYDTQGRLRVKDTPEGTLTYDYDTAGAVTRISARTNYTGWAAQPPYSFESLSGTLGNTNGAEWNYRYDQLGRLEKVNPDTTATNSPADATYTFDDLGNLQTTTYRNGLATTCTYNERNWLRMLETKLGSATVARFDYDAAATGVSWPAERHLSPTGLRQRVVELVGSATRLVDYDHDRLRRLIGENIDPSSAGPNGTVRYDASYPGASGEGYDPLGNRQARRVTVDNGLSAAGVTSTSHAYNSLDQIDPTTFGYDANGNTTNDASSAAYLYDAENRLIQCQTTISNQPATINIIYDADGNRVSKTVTNNGSTTTTRYLVEDHDPTGYAQVMEEWVSQNSGPPELQCLYCYGLALISQKRGNAVSYYGYDGLGSVRFLADAAGAVTDTYTYDAFGIQIATTGTTPNNYRYTSQQWDPHFGMYYHRARYYRPVMGRFWTTDTSEGTQEDPLSFHKYLYCQANPANSADPSGHETLLSVSATANIVAFLATHEARGASAALKEARTLFGAGETVNQIIWGLDVFGIVDEKVGELAMGGAAVYGSLRLYSWIKNWVRIPSIAKGVMESLAKIAKLFPKKLPKPVNAEPQADHYLYRVIYPGTSSYREIMKELPNIGSVGTIRPKGGHNDVMRHLEGDTRSIFTSWSKDQAGNWNRWGVAGAVQARIDIRRLQNAALDVTELAGSDEILIIGDIAGVERVR